MPSRRDAATLIVEIPPYRRPEREYALSVLLGDWLGIRYRLQVVSGLSETRIRHCGGGETEVVLRDSLLRASTPWLTVESLPAVPLATAPFPDCAAHQGPVPVLYTDDHRQPLVARAGSSWVVHLDVLGSAFFLLSRYEELVRERERDEHDRFPVSASVVRPGNWHEWPILDMYLELLAATLQAAWPGLRLRKRAYEGVSLSHDIDHPSSTMLFRSMTTRMRVLIGDLLHRREVGLASRRARAFLHSSPELPPTDPFNTYDFLMTTSESVGATSTFFVMAKDTHIPNGSPYRLSERWTQPLLRRIARRGHRIGLHASYHSSGDVERVCEEWALLAAACEGDAGSALMPAARQHYLRWNPRSTWQAQAAAGLRSDHSLGFANAIGFRAGTARSFRPFDLAARSPLPMVVEPLLVMDGAMLYYMLLNPVQTIERTMRIYERVRAFGGRFSLLWHNSSLDTRALRKLYVSLVRAVAT